MSMPQWCDAHLHLQDHRFSGQLGEIVARSRMVGVSACVVNGTCEADWHSVAQLAREYPGWVIPSFGVHPWHAAAAEPGWDERLVALLEAFPQAGIGECGLDRWIRDPQIGRQTEVFERQLELAQAYNRPLSVHCLKAWGLLLEVLERHQPSRVLIHSFGGSLEVAQRLLRLGAYFSFSGYFLQPRKQPVLEVFRQLPLDRILLETDAPDMLPPAGVIEFPLPEDINHPANLPAIGRSLATALGIPANVLAEVMSTSFRSFFALLTSAAGSREEVT